MNSKTLHIIGNEYSWRQSHSDEWWTQRLNVYEHYCLSSLKNQTNKNFLLLMTIVQMPIQFEKRLRSMLAESGLKYVIRDITFEVPILKNISTTQEQSIQSNKNSLSEIVYPFIEGYEYIYYTRIDSDDMYHKDAVNEIQSYDFALRRALIFQKGYCYDCRENKLRHYFMPSPPFSTIMYPIDIFLDEQKKAEYNNFRSHDELSYKMECIALSENKFIVTVHGTNNATSFESNRNSEKDIEFEYIDNILKDFGTSVTIYKNKIQNI